MNRTVWIARFVALLILLATAVLFMNLHSKLTKLQEEQQSAAPATST
jgi:hypothetical protein